MFRIAICDDDSSNLDQLYTAVTCWLNDHPQAQGEIVRFDSPSALKQSCEDGMQYDTFLLDIMMPEVTGIDLARSIRKTDKEVPILFLTSSDEFALAAFEVYALRYLQKPLQTDALFSALDLAYRVRPKSQEPAVVLHTAAGLYSLRVRDILYVENVDRTAVYHSIDGRDVSVSKHRQPFERSIAPLPSYPGFMQPHKSFLVNMRHILSLQNFQLLMRDGKVIPISQLRLAEVKRIYFDYLSAKSEGL